ncbi:MAG: aspartyl protease family protein [Candidatus Eremiobacteraeota bacterium]|nr:aspartyl protease family protein [Candidatus Eremiobacteraeota bacterium]
MNLAPWLLAATLTAQTNAPAATGDAAFARGDFDAAFRAYSAAVIVAPNDFGAVLGLGTMDLYRGDLAAAQLYLAKALQLNPSDDRAKRRMRALQQLQDKPGDFDISMTQSEADVPFVVTDPLPMIRAKINGANAFFLIDTGAPGVELSAATATRLHVPMHMSGEGVFAGGMKAQVFAGRIDSIEFPGVRIRGMPVGQLPSAMPTTLAGRSYDGVIGTNLLRRFLSTLDYRDGKLILRPRSASDSFETAAQKQKAAIVPMWLVPDHFIFARATVNGSFDGLFSIDTGGAGLGLTLTKASLAAANITPDQSKASSGFGGGGTVSVVPFTAVTVTLGSFTQKNVQGLYTPAGDPYGRFPFAVAGAISHEFFRNSALTFDFSARRLVVAP